MSSQTPLVTTLVHAGAGTGKTEGLANRIVDAAVLLQKTTGSMPHLIATTFTERATTELRERVIQVAGRVESNQLLMELVLDPRKLRISTIHGVFSMILHRYASLIGLDPEFSIMSDERDRELREKALRFCFSKNEKQFGKLGEEYSFLELSQILRVLLEVKRRQEVLKVRSFWKEIYNQKMDEALGVSQKFLGLDVSSVPAKTGETLKALQIACRGIVKVSLDKFRDAFLQMIAEFRKPVVRNSEIIKESIDHLFSLRDEFEEEYFDPKINERHSVFLEEFENLVTAYSSEYENLKAVCGQLTFDDLESATLKLLETHPNIAQSLQSEWDHWFIDEYQDTSPLQKRILFLLFKKPWNAYFVGDPQQSVYLFRGSDPKVFTTTLNEVRSQNGVIETSEVNYRSESDLVHFFNYLFKTMPYSFRPLLPKEEAKGQTLAQIVMAPNEDLELSGILGLIHNWKIEGFNFSDIAILVRQNREGQKIAKFLSQKGVPTYLHAAGGFYDRREVMDALHVLCVLHNPYDEVPLIGVLRSPWIGMADSALYEWKNLAKNKSLWSSLDSLPEQSEELRFLIEQRGRVLGTPLSVVFRDTLERLGFFEAVLISDSSGQREANLRKLLEALRIEEGREDFSASAFIRVMKARLKGDLTEGDAASFIEPHRVNIITVHKSKGLKFNCVVIPGCGRKSRAGGPQLVEAGIDGSFAVRMLSSTAEKKIGTLDFRLLQEEREERDWEESLRVFYVGVTRAAKRLALITDPNPDPKSWLGCSTLGLEVGLNEEGRYSVSLMTAESISAAVVEVGEEKIFPPDYDFLKNTNSALKKSSATKNTDKGADLWKIKPRDLFQSQLRGVALHKVFENLNKYGLGSLETVVKEAEDCYKVELGLKKVAQILDSKVPPILEIIKKGFSEMPFRFIEEGRIFSGQIDIWADLGDQVWVIDYKSASGLDSKLVAKTTDQLQYYGYSLVKSGIDHRKIRLGIVLPLSGEVLEVKFPSVNELRKKIFEQVIL